MILVISLLLIAQGVDSRWDSPDILIEDSLGSYVDFAVDYNYSNGNIYVACIPDSGTYFGPENCWGLLLFRSTDHGLSWDLLHSEIFALGCLGKGIDLVVTRSDTVYVIFSYYVKGDNDDEIGLEKIYEGEGGTWERDWIPLIPNIRVPEIRSPKLVRDDFDDFYLYMSYLTINPDRDSLIILRSTDRGKNWSRLLRASSAAEWQDHDITVSDSSIYHLSTFQSGDNQTLQVTYWRDRGIPVDVINLQEINTNEAGQIRYPRIGATTTLPDSGQLVYAFFSQENPGGGNDLLYQYSQNGGADWDSIPDTLADESYSPVLCDLRGYQAAPNQWMDITYCFTSSAPSFENFWCWSSEGEPTNWQGTTSVGTGANRSVPELIYSPGAPGGGGAVVFNDSLGNLWFDAPWYSGISENTDIIKKKISSKIVPAGSTVEVGSAGAIVYDVTGRVIKILNTNSWDLKDGEGKEVEGGIYFIVEKENGNRTKLSILK
ncbi:hypothetical protein JW879_09540 [candidate division WOR-3 bacterium]|nr:hypothetical protein [candidate division WOR-3 bacterium]